MKKLLLIPIFLVGVATLAKAQAPTTSGGQDNKDGPVMTFDVTEYNFGTIKQGDIVTYEFKFKNTGKEPLIINNAVGSCGCTVPEWPKEPIRANGSGVIKVTFNSAGKLGQQDKTVTLTYDTDKQIQLHLKGTVEAPAATPAPGANTPAAPAQTGGGKTATATPAASTSPATKSSGTNAPAGSKSGSTNAPAGDKPKN
ncbi:MAG TPA: DUF1573 domain-containing protein [Bacteroidia bacterium]|nr:DUF1573 domain-containing protein [Bacteroidia bacterium]